MSAPNHAGKASERISPSGGLNIVLVKRKFPHPHGIGSNYFYGGGIDYDNPTREPYKRLYYLEKFAAEFAKCYLEILGISGEEIGGNHLTQEEQVAMKHMFQGIGRINRKKQ